MPKHASRHPCRALDYCAARSVIGMRLKAACAASLPLLPPPVLLPLPHLKRKAVQRKTVTASQTENLLLHVGLCLRCTVQPVAGVAEADRSADRSAPPCSVTNCC